MAYRTWIDAVVVLVACTASGAEKQEEADTYLAQRASLGHTVIQAVALAELDGLNKPNAYGHKPLIANDPTKPAVKDGPDNE